jgi:hypothetical protein
MHDQSPAKFLTRLLDELSHFLAADASVYVADFARESRMLASDMASHQRVMPSREQRHHLGGPGSKTFVYDG